MIMILIVMITILIRRTNLRTSGWPAFWAIIFLALVLAGCGATAGDDRQQGLRIVATTSVWGDVVEEIVGNDATVDVLIPPGADAHDYETTPQQVASLRDADLVVANGLALEEGLVDVLESAVSDGANVLELASRLEPLPFAGHDEEDEHHEDEDHAEDETHEDEDHAEDEAHEDEDHAHEGDDPHVWFDPNRVARATELIASRLAELDDSVDWAARAAAYSDRLIEADMEIAAILEVVPAENRKLVTNHDALGYFADRYGFDVIAVVIPGGSTLGDPSSAEMAELVEKIEHEGIRTIFAETSQPTRLAEAVASEVGDDISIVELYTGSLGEPGSEADTLIGMLTTNARRIAGALSG